MDLSGLAALTSNIVPGMQAGQDAQERIRAQQERNKQAALQTQEMLADRDATAALGSAFGLNTQPLPQPMAPGQPSQPAQPPQGGASAGPSPAPGGAAVAALAPGAMPAPGGAGAAPGVPPGLSASALMPGSMTLDQLAARIRAANPGIAPGTLARAMAKAQTLLAPEGKQELALVQMQAKLDQFAQTMQFKQQSEADRTQMQQALMDLRQRLNDQNWQGRADLQAQKTQDMIDLLLKKLEGQKEIQGQKDEAAQKRTDTQVQGRKDVAAMRSRGEAVKAATKAGVTVDPAWDDATLQQKTAEAVAKQAQGGNLTPESTTFLAQALMAGDNATVQLALGLSKNRPQILDQIVKEAQKIDPGFTGQRAAAALAQFGGMKTAASTVGRTAGAVEIGAQEIPQFAPKVEALTKKLNLSQYPTVNAVKLATERGTGNADVVELNSYIQSLRNAYQQVMARGGRMSDTQRKYAAELIDGSMPLSQISAAMKAMTTEAGVAQKATGAAMKAVTGQGDATPPADSDVPPQDASSLPDGTIATKGNMIYVVKDGQWVKK